MSNPLIKPDDPRFQRPEIRDAEGKNRFGESEQPVDEAPPPVPTVSAAPVAAPVAADVAADKATAAVEEAKEA